MQLPHLSPSGNRAAQARLGMGGFGSSGWPGNQLPGHTIPKAVSAWDYGGVNARIPNPNYRPPNPAPPLGGGNIPGSYGNDWGFGGGMGGGPIQARQAPTNGGGIPTRQPLGGGGYHNPLPVGGPIYANPAYPGPGGDQWGARPPAAGGGTQGGGLNFNIGSILGQLQGMGLGNLPGLGGLGSIYGQRPAPQAPAAPAMGAPPGYRYALDAGAQIAARGNPAFSALLNSITSGWNGRPPVNSFPRPAVGMPMPPR